MLPPTVRLLYLGRFFMALRFFAAVQVIYFAQVTGSYTLATSLLAASTISQACLELPTGVCSDTLGRSQTAVLASVAALVSVALYALAGGYGVLLAGAVVEGLARALGSGNSEALLYDALRDAGQEERYHHANGRLGAIEAAGFGLAALAGGAFASRSMALALWLSVLTQALAVAVALRVAEPASTSRSTLNPYRHLREAATVFRRNPRLRLLTLAQTWSEALGESSFQFAPIFLQSLLPLWGIGVLRAATNLLSAAGFYLSGPIIDRLGALRTLVGRFLGDRACLLLAYGMPGPWSVVLMTVTALIYGPAQVAQGTLLQREFIHQQRATLGSLDSLVGSVGLAASSVAIGVVADRIGPRNVLLLAQVLLLPVIAIYWRIFRHNGQRSGGGSVERRSRPLNALFAYRPIREP